MLKILGKIKSNKFFPISITDPKPKIPTLYAVQNNDGKQGVKIVWKSNDESDVVGYRLYYSINSDLSNWQIAADETQLTQEINEYSIISPSEFKVPTSEIVNFYKLTAVDLSGQESEMSDVFSVF